MGFILVASGSDSCPTECNCYHSELGCQLLVRCDDAGLSSFPHVPVGTDCLQLRENPRLGELSQEQQRDQLRTLSGLKLLDLHGCRLGSKSEGHIPADLLHGFTSLRWLCLEGNNLIDLPQGLFAQTPHLRMLQLTGPFESSDGGNCWPPGPTQRPRGFRRMCKMHNAAANRLRALPVGIFGGLDDLHVLMLHHNALNDLPVDAFVDLNQLRVLKLLDNAVSFNITNPAFATLLRKRKRCAKGRATRGECLQLDVDEDTGDDLEDIWVTKHKSFWGDGSTKKKNREL